MWSDDGSEALVGSDADKGSGCQGLGKAPGGGCVWRFDLAEPLVSGRGKRARTVAVVRRPRAEVINYGNDPMIFPFPQSPDHVTCHQGPSGLSLTILAWVVAAFIYPQSVPLHLPTSPAPRHVRPLLHPLHLWSSQPPCNQTSHKLSSYLCLRVCPLPKKPPQVQKACSSIYTQGTSVPLIFISRPG